MINGLLMGMGVVGLTSFVTAIMAWLTMLQIRKKIKPIFRGDPRTLRLQHIVSGRISLATFVLLAFIGTGLAFYMHPPSTIRAWFHVIVSIVAAGVFVAKVAVVRSKAQPWFRNMLPFGHAVMAFQGAIFLSATVWAFYLKFVGTL